MFLVQKRQVRRVASVFHIFDWNKMERGGVNRVALSGGRFRVGENIAEMGGAAFRGDSGPLHIVGSIQFFNQQIFRDWLGKRWLADARIVFVERTKEGFAGDDIDV